MFYDYYDIFGNRRGSASSKSEAETQAMKLNDYIMLDMARKYKEALIHRPNLTFESFKNEYSLNLRRELKEVENKWDPQGLIVLIVIGLIIAFIASIAG